MTEQKNKTALIIGAGPAGLTAAYYLLKHTDIKPIIFEASNEIGGISKTVQYHGNYIDIGGHRFFSKNEEIMALWNEIMPLQAYPAYDDIVLNSEKNFAKTGPNPETDDIVMLIRRRVSRILYLGKFFDYPVTLKASTLRNMGFVRTMKAGFGYIGSSIHKRKETNLENFYINRFGKPLYKMFFEKYTTKVWGLHPSEIDASWGAQRVKGLSLWKTLGNAIARPFRRKKSKKVETSLIEEFYYPKYGPGHLYTHMAKLVTDMGGELHLNHEVIKVNVKDNKVTSLVCKVGENTIEFTGDYFFSSMPLKDLFNAFNGENIDQEAKDIATSLIYRDFITVGVLTKKLLLENKTKMKTLNNIIPDTWIYVQEENVKVGRLQIFNNWSPYMVKDVNNTVWLGMEFFVNEGDEMWNMSDEEFIDKALNELEQIKVVDRKDVLDTVRIKVKKAYPAYFGRYKEIDKVIAYLNTIENLYCVGRNGQHRYNNMDHSMLTAIEAVRVLTSNGELSKDIIWKVNTEKEYHEEKNGKK
jgi:protoporphyrinogen oxidase